MLVRVVLSATCALLFSPSQAQTVLGASFSGSGPSRLRRMMDISCSAGKQMFGRQSHEVKNDKYRTYIAIVTVIQRACIRGRKKSKMNGAGRFAQPHIFRCDFVIRGSVSRCGAVVATPISRAHLLRNSFPQFPGVHSGLRSVCCLFRFNGLCCCWRLECLTG